MRLRGLAAALLSALLLTGPTAGLAAPASAAPSVSRYSSQIGDDGTDVEAAYGRIEDTPKRIVRLSGANHYGITGGQNPAGADPDGSAQTITREQSIATAARWAARFLEAALGGAASAEYVWTTGDADDPLVTVTGAQ